MNNKRLLFFVVFLFSSLLSFCQEPNVELMDKNVQALLKRKESIKDRERVRFLTIAVDDFLPSGDFNHLDCVYNSKNYIEPLEESFKKNYKDCVFSFSYADKKKSPNSSRVKELLDNWRNDVLEGGLASNSLAILYLSSHGYVDNSLNYYFITSDSSTSNLKETAVSGKEIVDCVKYLADAGVIVIVFIDTCHAEALYKKEDICEDSYRDKLGGIAFFAASEASNSSYVVDRKSLFTRNIAYCLGGYDAPSLDDNQALLVSCLASFMVRGISNATDYINYQNQNPKYLLLNTDNFRILKKCSSPSYPLSISSFIPFRRIPDLSDYPQYASMNSKGKTRSIIYKSLMGVSLLSAATSSGILIYQNSRVNNLDSAGLDSNTNRRYAREACIGLYTSGFVFAVFYFLQVGNIHSQYELKHTAEIFSTKEHNDQHTYSPTLSFAPSIDNNHIGVGLTYRF